MGWRLENIVMSANFVEIGIQTTKRTEWDYAVVRSN